MKKSIITLLTLTCAAWAQPTAVWTSGALDMTQVQTIDLTQYMLSTEGSKGITLMVDMVGVTHGGAVSSFWVGTDIDNVHYNNSAATLVWSYEPKLANAANGSSNKGVINLDGQGTTYVTDGTYAGSKSSDLTTTFFITSCEGTAYLYQKGATEGVVLMFGNDQMVAGAVEYLQISNWNKDAANGAGTATFSLYDGVLTKDEMGSLAYPGRPSVPEPTTATLSLLALAGLVARRRRK